LVWDPRGGGWEFDELVGLNRIGGFFFRFGLDDVFRESSSAADSASLSELNFFMFLFCFFSYAVVVV
jgi:hypothetical protein